MNIEEQHKGITIRFAIVAALAVLLIVPTLLVSTLVSERWSFFREAVGEIKETWSSDQVLVGPTIMVAVSDAEDFQRVAFMPEVVDMSIDSTHEYRTRTIFTTPVLSFDVHAQGNFAPIDLEDLANRHENVYTDHAVVSFAVTDVRGVSDPVLMIDGQQLNLEVFDTGFGKSLNAKVPADFLRNGGSFEFSASMRASDGVHVVPHADNSSINIASTWPHPKFDGDLLPRSREVTNTGFNASWEGNAVSRGFNQRMYLPGIGVTHQGEMVGPWLDVEHPVSRSSVYRTYMQDASAVRSIDPLGQNLLQVGFTVLDPVTPYRKISRTVNYGILFIILTFGAILCIELVTPVQFHYVQYGVIGTALVVFFLTTLAIAEHLQFGIAYLIASALMTAMLTAYTHYSARNRLITAAIVLLLILLYVVLYLILQLENYALLVGTSLLVLLLGVLMWATKNLTLIKESEEAS